MENLIQILNDVKKVPRDGSALDLVMQVRPIIENFNEKDGGEVFRVYDTLASRLQSITRVPEASKEKIAILDLFIITTKKFKSASLSNCVRLKDAAFAVFRASRISSERAAGLALIHAVLEACHGGNIVSDLDINGLSVRLFEELSQTPTATILQNVMNVLGIIAKLYPEYFNLYSERLNDIAVKMLRKEMTSKNKAPQLAAIAGCVCALGRLYTNFPPKGNDDEIEIPSELSRFVKKLINPAVDMKRYEAVRQSLDFFIQHASLMQRFIYQECRDLFEYIMAWCINAKDTETKYRAEKAMKKLFEQVSLALTEAKNADLVRYFVVKLRNMLEQNKSSIEVTIAIYGFGSFAKLLRVLLSGNEVRQLFDLVIRHMEKIHLATVDNSNRRLYKLPSHLQSLAAIVSQMEEMSDVFLSSLTKLVVEMVSSFPRVSSSLYRACLDAIYSILRSLKNKPAAFSMFLEQMVFLSLIYTCSHTPPTMDSDSKDAPEDELSVSYKQFLPLWNMLLNMKVFLKSSVDEEGELEEFSTLVYRQFIISHLHVVERLDLTLNTMEDAEKFSDPTAGLVASNARDVTIFVNLVDCVTDVLSNCEPRRLIPWFSLYMKSLMKWQHEHPVLSGFYKLFANALRLANKAEYFADSRRQDEVSILQALANRVLASLKQYRNDDLRVAILQLILSLPANAVREMPESLIPAMEEAAELSVSHPMMMQWLLDAIESWVKEMEPDDADTYLRRVLPLLEPLLHSQDRSQSQTDNEKKIDDSRRGLAQVLRRVHKQQARALATSKFSAHNQYLEEVQSNLLEFLGRLGGRYNYHFIRNITEHVEADQLSLVHWDSKNRLTFTLPFRDVKVDIELDAFLPHIVFLATGSGDRQSRISACELLHSLVIFMVGRSESQVSRPSRQSEGKEIMSGIWKKIFPVLLQLACDLDQTIRELMCRLVMQIIHWFTRPVTFKSRDTEIILNAIFKALASSNHEASRRDFAAQALKEFIIWSIKHSPNVMETEDESQVNVDSVMNRLAQLAIHPNSQKRLGAAVGFNAIYRQFREEKRLVNKFTFLLLDNFIHSMALAERDFEGQGILSLTERSIDHLEKIIEKMSGILSQPNDDRRCPRLWEVSCTIDVAVRQILWHCSRPEPRCRRRCMKLMSALAGKIPGIDSLNMFFNNRLQAKGPSYIVERFESGSLALKSFPSTDVWMKKICGVQECYIWAISQNLLPVKILLSSSDSKLLVALIEFYAWLQKEKHASSLTAWITVGTMSLLVCLCNHHKMIENDYAWKAFCCNVDLINVMATTFLMPRILGFTLSDVEVIVKLPDECEQLMQWFKYAPEEAQQQLRRAINRDLHKIFGDSFQALFNKTLTSTSSQDVDDFLFLMESLQRLAKNKWISHSIKFLEGRTREVLNCIVKSSTESCKESAMPKQAKIRMRTLKFLLEWTLDIDWLVETLCSSDIGEQFYSTSHSILDEFIISHKSNQIISSLMSRSGTHPAIVSNILEQALEVLKKQKKLRDKFSDTVVNAVISSWKCLEPWWKGNNIDRKMSVIGFMTKLLLLQPKTANEGEVSKTYVHLLKDISIFPRTRVLDLLGYFMLNTEILDDLSSALNEFSGQLPPRSSDLILGSTEASEYNETITRLFTALEVSGNIKLLQVLIGIFCREDEHTADEEFARVLSQLGENLNAEKQRSFLDLAFSFLYNEGLSSIYRRLCVTKVLMPLLQVVDIEGNAEPEEGPTISLIRKTAALQIFEETYLRLSKQQVHFKECLIIKAICSAENKEAADKIMTIRLIKACESVLSEDHSSGPDVVRRMLCAAYNCLIAVELEAPLRIKAQFEAASKQRKARASSEKEDIEGEDVEESQVAYISSQYLTQSSLSTELSQYDRLANTQILLSQAAGEGTRPILRRIKSTRKELLDIGVDLEEDCVNSHPCMVALVRLIRHMEKSGILRNMGNEAAPDLHNCLKFFYNKLSNNTTHPNVKIFIAKLIVNCQKTFRPYANFFLIPLCRLIVSEQNGGTGIHTLIVDIMYVLLSWEKFAIPKDTFDDRALAGRVVEFIMENCHHDNRSILRNNLSMLKLTLECWKSRIRVDSLIISRHMKMVDTKNPRSALGIQMLAAVIANGLPYYTPSSAIDRETFQRMLSENVTHEFKQVYAAASEVCGMLLSRMSSESDPDLPSFQERVANVISTHQARNRLPAFIHCLALVCKHFLPLSESFLSKLIFELPRMQEDSLAQAIDILARCPFDGEEKRDRLYVELKGKGFFDLLSQKKSRILLPALRLCSRLLDGPKVSGAQRTTIVNAIVPCAVSAHVEVRRALYEVLVEHYHEDDCREHLLQAMSESDEATRLFVQNFWSSTDRLSAATCERSIAIFQAMYSAHSEKDFLSYSNSLMLELTSRSTDYRRSIFPDLDPECKFEVFLPAGLTDAGGTKERGASLMPLFISAVPQEESEKPQNEDSKADAKIRATVEEPQFTQTQVDGESRRTFNWLTQGSLPIDSMSLADADTIQSALMIDSGSSRRSDAASRSRLKSAGENQLSERELDLLRLRKRFTNVSNKERFRELTVRRQKVQEKRKLEGPRNAVTLYRSYRHGELPDVQIDYASLIAPLQALADCDTEMSSRLLSELTQAIWLESHRSLDDEDQEEIGKRLKQGIENVLSKSKLFSAPVVGCVLQIGLELRKKGHRLDPALVSSSAIAAGHEALAKLLLEEELCQRSDVDSESMFRAPKRPRLSTPSSACVELARLYKSDDDIDNLIGLLEVIDLDSYSNYKSALQDEAQGDFTSAKEKYLESIEQAKDTADMSFIAEDGLLQCYNNLNSWERLDGTTSELGADFESRVWDNMRIKDLVLPLRVRASTKLLEYDVIHDKDDLEAHENLLQFFNVSLEDAEYMELCNTTFCEELAIMSIIHEDYDRAQSYCKTGFKKAISGIGDSNKFQSSRKTTRCQRLQVLTEMQDFLQVIRKTVNIQITGVSLDRLFDRWTKRQPHPILTPCPVWEDIITNRFLYFSKLCAGIADMDDDSQPLTLDKYRIKWSLAQVGAANKQRNHRLALNCLKEAKTILSNITSASPEEDLVSDFYSAFVETWQYEVARQLTIQADPDPLIQRLLGLHGQLNRFETSKPSRYHRLLAENAVLIQECLQSVGVGSESRGKVVEYLKCETTRQIDDAIFKCVVDNLQASIKGCVDGHSVRSSSDARIALASFCDRYLRHHEETCEDETMAEVLKYKQFPLIFVESVLSAMKEESIEARLRFPRALQIAEYYSDTREAIIQQVASIPSWMFLMWLSQLLASLDKPESAVVQDILLRIAEDYPNAFVYPFKVKQSSFDFDDEEESGMKAKSVSVKLQEMMSKLPQIDRFLSGLDQLSQPSSLFSEWSTELTQFMSRTPAQRKKNQILKKFQEVRDMLFEEDEKQSEVSLYGETLEHKGEFRRMFGKKFVGVFDSRFGKNGKKLLEMKPSEYNRAVRELHDQMKSITECPTILEKYSMWLAQYDGLKYTAELEVPGQYHGWSMPHPERHAKIVRFMPSVLTLNSLRKPKRIKLLGSDQKDYMFLVKGGEDMRQDQRLEQAFEIVNRLFRWDPNTSRRQLRLRTYAVIPLTTRVGILEWVNNSIPLSEILKSQNMTKFENDAITKAWKNHLKLFGIEKTNDLRLQSNYIMSFYASISKKQMVPHFKALQEASPHNTLRRNFVNMSASPEAFHALRSSFQCTYGTMCAVHYLFGIGDRHAGNIMICQSTGEAIGIDFGYAFGLHLQLSVLELTPFRLTRQLQTLMEPTGLRGQYAQCMVATLSALRKRKDLMMTLMQVFVKDKSVDWKRCADRARRENRGAVSVLDTDESWFPRQRIGLVRRKFEGEHPALILCDEIRLFKGPLDWCAHACDAIMGTKAIDKRAELSHDRPLTSQEQTDVLIDIATDPNILGRHFYGWNALC